MVLKTQHVFYKSSIERAGLDEKFILSNSYLA